MANARPEIQTLKGGREKMERSGKAVMEGVVEELRQTVSRVKQLSCQTNDVVVQETLVELVRQIANQIQYLGMDQAESR